MKLAANNGVAPSQGTLTGALLLLAMLLILLGAFSTMGAMDSAGKAPEGLAYMTGAIPFDKVRSAPDSAWKPVEGMMQSFGYKNPQAWMRFKLRGGARPQTINVAVGPSFVESCEFYLVSDTGTKSYQSGKTLPDGAGARLTGEWTFPVNLSPGQTKVGFVHFTARGRSLGKVSILTEEQLRVVLRSSSTRVGLVLGISCILILVCAMLTIINRSLMYASYLGYLIAAVAILLNFEKGLALNLPAHLFFVQRAALAGAGCFLLLTFARLFLRLPNAPWWARWTNKMAIAMQALLGITIAAVITTGLTDWQLPLNPGLNLVVLGTVLIAVLAGVVATLLRLPQAPLFLMGWILFGGFVGFHQLGVLGLHSWSTTTAPLHLGIIAEALVFSMALALRSRTVMQERVFSEERLARLGRELAQARRVQQRLLPRSLPAPTGLEIAARYEPESELGGDLYAFHQPSEHELIAMMADVTGHGLGAALDSAVVWAAFREAVLSSKSPAAIISSMNRFLAPHVGFRFVTACCVHLDTKTKVLRLASGGHVWPLRLRDSRAEFLEANGTLLGFDPQATYQEHEFELRSGDRLLLYTDGLFESHSRTTESGTDVLLAQARSNQNHHGREWLDQLFTNMERWRNDPAQTDDVSLVSIEVS